MSPTILKNNYANKSSGCIYADNNSILNITKYNIIHNTGTYGGALWINNSYVTLIGSNNDQTSVAQNHIAFGFGGFIVAFNSILDIHKYNIIHNTAGTYGGAFFIANSSFTLLAQYNFANQTGGVIVAINSMIDINKYNMIENTASYGGALYM